MTQQMNKIMMDEVFFISAIKHEIFSRIFSTIRHDIVGNVSATLIRLSIIERILKNQELDVEKIKSEVQKLDHQLRVSIIDIRELSFWDFPTSQADFTGVVLQKSILLIASQLALKGIHLHLQEQQHDDVIKVDSKSLMYSLLCLFCYIEDNDFDNFKFNIFNTVDSIVMTYEPMPEQHQPTIIHNRNICIDKEIATQFISLNKVSIDFSDKCITLKCIN
ncbi:MAG: hypothetical protein V4575_01140 [Pseudomonadota bacterium]